MLVGRHRRGDVGRRVIHQEATQVLMEFLRSLCASKGPSTQTAVQRELLQSKTMESTGLRRQVHGQGKRAAKL